MIQVTLGTNTDREKVIIEPTRTIRSVLDEHNIDYAAGAVRLDSNPIGGADLDKTFEEHGVGDTCWLIVVVKANGGK